MNVVTNKDVEINSATNLATVEIVIGSLGHGFKIPLIGTFLSYYQLYILLRMIIRLKVPSIQVFNVSIIVSLLKTLSPFGKKITPMIAITMQGFLLWLGTFLMSENLLGLILGSILFVTWSMLQSILGYIILYGLDFFKMIDFFQKQLNADFTVNLYFLIGGYWLLKVVGALVVITYVTLNSKGSQDLILNEQFLNRWRRPLRLSEGHRSDKSNWKRAVSDLINPFFFLSLILMVLFHFYKDTGHAEIVWLICRTLGLGFVMFYLLRSNAIKRLLLRWFGSDPKFRVLYKKMYRVKRRLSIK